MRVEFAVCSMLWGLARRLKVQLFPGGKYRCVSIAYLVIIIVIWPGRSVTCENDKLQPSASSADTSSGSSVVILGGGI